MDAVLADFFNRLSAMHESMTASLDGLPSEALSWVPGQEMNSMAVLATHTAGSERYWIGDIVGKDPSGRVRSDEFLATSASAAELIAGLEAALSHSQATLGRLSLDQLAERRLIASQDREVTVAYALLHALEHAALHTGHMELTRQLWDQRTTG